MTGPTACSSRRVQRAPVRQPGEGIGLGQAVEGVAPAFLGDDQAGQPPAVPQRLLEPDGRFDGQAHPDRQAADDLPVDLVPDRQRPEGPEAGRPRPGPPSRDPPRRSRAATTPRPVARCSTTAGISANSATGLPAGTPTMVSSGRKRDGGGGADVVGHQRRTGREHLADRAVGREQVEDVPGTVELAGDRAGEDEEPVHDRVGEQVVDRRFHDHPAAVEPPPAVPDGLGHRGCRRVIGRRQAQLLEPVDDPVASSGWMRSIPLAPWRTAGSEPETHAAEALIQRKLRSGSTSETTAEGERSMARRIWVATVAGCPRCRPPRRQSPEPSGSRHVPTCVRLARPSHAASLPRHRSGA